jgi:hypothetical protein
VLGVLSHSNPGGELSTLNRVASASAWRVRVRCAIALTLIPVVSCQRSRPATIPQMTPLPYGYLPPSAEHSTYNDCHPQQPSIDTIARITQPLGRIDIDAENPGAVSGVITTRNGKPLVGVNVVIAARNVSVGTDATGTFHIKPLPAGRYALRTRGIGYEPRTDTVEVTATSGVRVRLPLEDDANHIRECLVFGPNLMLYHAKAELGSWGRWLFYLPGELVEEQGVEPKSPVFGAYEYLRMEHMLMDSAFDIISEPRKLNTDPDLYADSIAQQIHRLLAGGVPARNISVLGDSKGALIAMLVSTRLIERDIRYVVLGGCSRSNLTRFPLQFHGNVLSIYEYADTLGGSCATVFRRSTDMGQRKELMLQTGLGHGVFFHPLVEWLAPAIAWIRTPK